jgi:ribosomal protein S18 acetylase RimI-like enzyme
MQMTRRTLGLADVDGIAGLFVDVFNAPPWSDGWTLDAARERLDGFLSSPTSFGVVFIENDTPVAFALGHIERWIGASHFHLKEMCVSHERQRRGVGAELLELLAAQLRERHVQQIFCETRPDTAAESFYVKAGFRQLNLVSLAKKL